MKITVKDERIVEVLTHNLGRALIKARGSRSLRAVAEEIGVDYSALQRIERGGEMSVRTFFLMMDWLGIPVPKDIRSYSDLSLK